MCSNGRSCWARHLCCIYRSQPEMSIVWPETEMSCMAGAEMSRMAGDGDILYGRSGDVSYGRRRRYLVWPEMTIDSDTG